MRASVTNRQVVVLLCSVLIFFSAVIAAPAVFTETATASDTSFTEGSGDWVTVNDTVSLSVDNTETVGEAKIILENPHSGDELRVNESVNGNVDLISSASDITDEIGDTRMVIELEAANGEATEVSDFEEMFQTAEFRNTESETSLEDRRVRFSLGSRLPMDETGHYYGHSSTERTWSDARDEVHAYPYNGSLSRDGYLATIRSADENQWVNSVAGSNRVWLAAADADGDQAEGEWEWEAGSPEDEVRFWTEDGGLQYGYENWASGEPNDDGGEDRLEMLSDGTWNDANEDTNKQYVYEYGDDAIGSDLNTVSTVKIADPDAGGASFPLTEEFNSDSVPSNWTIGGDAEWGVSSDGSAGDETLRLTTDGEFESGYGLFDQGFSSEQGVYAEFDYYADDGDGADGLSFFLVNGTVTDASNIGTSSVGGAGFGYTQLENGSDLDGVDTVDGKTDAFISDPSEQGVPNAYVGVGYDEYGLFSSDEEGKDGGEEATDSDPTDREQHNVAIRGEGDLGTYGSGYAYQTGANVTDIDSNYRIDGGWRKVRVNVQPTASGGTNLTVDMSWNGGDDWETVIDQYTYENDPPSTLKLGFAGSTGSSTNYHAIDNLEVSQLPIISNLRASNPTGDEIDFQFDADQQLDEINVDVTGDSPSQGTLTDSDFNETENDDGNYTYTLDTTLTGDEDGDYDLTLNTAENANGLDGAAGQSDSVTITSPPSISTFSLDEGEGDGIKTTIESDKELKGIDVDIEDPDGNNDTLTRIDFTETVESGTYTYTADYTAEKTGTYTGTLQSAEDEDGRDGASSETDTVEISEPDDSEGGVRHTTKDGSLFLGSDFIELGIRPDGGFGSEVTAPSSFFGNERGNIGIYADVDGFYNDTYDYRYEYFLPGSPEERWSMGYGGPDTGTTASNGRNVYTDPPEMPTIGGGLTDQSTDKIGAGNLTSEFDDLEIDQRYELQPDSRYYKTTVEITNTGSTSLDDVRYQRSFDPDNGVDEGCSFTTNNTVVNQQPTDDNVLVKAELTDDDLESSWGCDVGDVSKIPVFYYSVEPDARVSYGDFGLVPDNPPYADRDYDNPPEAGSSKTADSYIAITFDAGTLADGETVEYSYYTGLTDDIDTTLTDVENEAEAQPPVADAGSNRTVEVGKTVEFDGSNSSANVSIESYDWDFDGDGTTDASGETVTHSFDEAGTYEVELNVADAQGQSDTNTTTITVEDPPGLSVSDGESEFVEFRGPVTVDPALDLSSPSALDGATVQIEVGLDSDTDVLDATENHGITKSYDSSTGVLSLSGEATASEYQEVLRSVTYEHTASKPDSVDREIVFTVGTDVVRSEATGQFYEYVEDSGSSWTEARDAATSRDHFGLDGSLATITSEAENDFLVSQFDAGGWIGASDADEESVWRWVTGPEGLEAGGDGRQFFDQTASHTGTHRFASVYPRPPEGVPGGGEAVDGEYENWDPRHEPNNKFPMKDGQDYGYLCSDTRGCTDGQWMDLNGDLPSEPTPEGYLVQYGGIPDDRDVTTTDSRTVAVTKDRAPTAETGTDEIEASLTDEIEFNASSASDDFGIVSYDWAFGDTNSASGEVVTHSYSSDGTYTVTLTVEDNQTQTDSDTMTVDIEDDTVRIADAGPARTVNEGNVIELDGSRSEATGDITAYDWDLGSGETTSGEKPTVSYDDPGTYTVELEITDEYGKTATDTTTIEVRDTTAPDADAGSDASVDEGTSITLDASGSEDNVGIDSYEWDLYGNGTTDATGETVDHTFEEPGTYEVELTTRDAAGNTDRDTVTITVDDSTDPTATIDVDETTVSEGEPLEFDAGDSEDNVALDSFEWDFDDGLTNGTGVTTTHRYTEAGTYEVTLAANDTSDNTGTNTVTITVEATPELSANGTETEYVEQRDAVTVNDSLDISGSGTIGGATVSVDDGFEDGDTLSYNNSLANENGISGRYDAESGVLSFEGTASETAYRDVLRSVTFEHEGSDPSETDRTITFSLGEDGLHFSGTGHYYEYVADDGITWHEARAAANESYHLGLQGYLVTVTSEAENEFVRSKLGGAGWMGASDADTEGTWRWVTGPEGTEDGGDGRHFFTQTASDDGTPDVYGGNTPGGGNAEGSDYTNWDVNEPNDHLSGEDYAHFCMDIGWCPDGTWNDFQYDHSGIDGYVIEYGGMDGDPDLNLTDTTTVTVERDDRPRAEAGSDAEVGLDEQVEFDASESSDDFGIETYKWDFDDGTTARGEAVLHGYDSDGRYDVTLTVTDTSYQTAVDSLGVRVIDNSVLVASTGGNYTADEGETVTFDASASEASAGIKSYEWEFHDSTTADGRTAKFTYDDPGSYEVNLTITDETDNTVSTNTSVEVFDITAPTADTGDNLTIDNGTAASFDASSSTDNVGIDSYEWDLTGNGVTDATGPDPTYTYPAPGNYTAELTTTDAAGNTDTDSITVNVTDIEPPTVDAGSDRTVEVLESVEFDGSNSTDDLAIESYEWDLYDNGTTDANGSTVDHVYAVDENGTYEVTLTVTDTSGNAATDTLTVDIQNTMPTLSSLEVTNPEDHEINVSFESDQRLDSITASVEGVEEATLSETDFTEVETDSGYRYEATYEGSTGGVYDVSLDSATDTAGNDATAAADETDVTGSVETLTAHASAVSYVTSVGSDVSFDASDTFVPDGQSEPTYEWDFDGDGTTDASGETVSHEFTSPGETEITLTATTDSTSSEDSTNITIEDRAPPETALDPVDSVANDTQVAFDASATTDNVSVDRYEWNFGDGTTDSGSTVSQPSHTYTEPGEYTVTVTAIDSSGNEETNETTVLVEGPVANVTTTALDFGDTPVDATNTLSVPVENEGNVPLEIKSGTGISGTDDALFELVGDAASLPMTIQPDETETVTVEYAPNAVATHTAQLDLTTNHSHGDFSIDLDGSGVDSDLKPQSSTLPLGTVDTGSETSETITLTNEGDGPSDLDSIEIVGTNADAFTVESVPDEIAAGEDGDLSIGFEPTHAGAHNATLRIENATGHTTATVPLSGFGNGPEIALLGDTVSFDEVGKNVSKAKKITVANHGTEALNLSSVTFDGSGSDAFTVESPSIPETVAAGKSTEIQISFTPTETQEYEASLVVEHNDSVAETQSLPVNGTGVAANIDASPRTLNFEETAVGETAYNRIKVRNLATSKTTLNVDKTDLVGKNPDEFGVENGDAPFSLEPGQSRYINVSFTPKSADSESSAQLQIESDAGNEPQITVWLSSSDTYIVVQQVATDSSSADDEPTVNLDAYNVGTGSDLEVNVSQPGTRVNDVGFDSYGMTTSNHEAFEINTSHADDPIGGDAVEYTPQSDEEIVQYARLNHSVDADKTFDNTSVTFRVAKDRVETDLPDDVTLYRYDGSSWNEMSATQIGETNTHFRYSSETPGFSQFVVGAATQTDSTDDDDSSDDGSDDGSTDDGSDDGSTDDGSDDGSTDDGSDDGSTDDGGDDGSTDDGSDDGSTEDGSKDGSTDDSSDDGSTEDGGDNTDTGTDGGTTDIPDGESEPTGDTENDDIWGDRTEFQNRTGLEIVDSHLTVDRADGINATSILTFHNGANVSQDVAVRFIMNGTLMVESTVTLSPDERMNVSHPEPATTSGVHTFEANVAAETAGGDLMRTFDFAVGTAEVTEDELAQSDTATDDETEEESEPETNTETAEGTFPWLIIVLLGGLILLLLLLLLAYRRRDDEEEEDHIE